MNQKGITLIELLVVVVILGIIGVVGSLALSNVISDTQIDMVEQEAVIIENAIEIHCMTTGCDGNNNGWVDVNGNELPTYKGTADNISYNYNDGNILIRFSMHGYTYDEGDITES